MATLSNAEQIYRATKKVKIIFLNILASYFFLNEYCMNFFSELSYWLRIKEWCFCLLKCCSLSSFSEDLSRCHLKYSLTLHMWSCCLLILPKVYIVLICDRQKGNINTVLSVFLLYETGMKWPRGQTARRAALSLRRRSVTSSLINSHSGWF